MVGRSREWAVAQAAAIAPTSDNRAWRGTDGFGDFTTNYVHPNHERDHGGQWQNCASGAGRLSSVSQALLFRFG